MKKKEINLIAAKNGLLGMKGYLETYNHMKYFLPYLSRFWLRPHFTPSMRGGFLVLKPKSRDLLPRNVVQTYNSLISNCCQNFMQLDQIVLELRYKQKSEISHLLVGKWPNKNKGTHDASVDCSNYFLWVVNNLGLQATELWERLDCDVETTTSPTKCSFWFCQVLNYSVV